MGWGGVVWGRLALQSEQGKEDRGGVGEGGCPPTYWVGGSLLPLLVHSVVPGNSAVSSLGFHRLAIRAHQNTCHHSKRPKT